MRYQIVVRPISLTPPARLDACDVRGTEVLRVSLWLRVQGHGRDYSNEWIGEEPMRPGRSHATERCRIAKKLLSSEHARIEKKQAELAKRLVALAKLEQELKK